MLRKVTFLITMVLFGVLITSSAAFAHSSDPWIRVRPLDDFVEGWMWPLGADVTLTIDGPECEGYPKTKTVGEFPHDPTQTYVTFELQGVCDLQADHVLTMTSGATTAELVIADVVVTNVNETEDTVSGTAAPGSSITVWPHEAHLISIATTADSSGVWLADFSGDYDLMPGTGGAAIQFDLEGDETWIDWYLPNARFTVGITHDWICGSEWQTNAPIAITIDGGDPYAALSNGAGEFCFELWEIIDLQAGQLVEVSDGSSIKSHTLLDLQVTGFDLDMDEISGTSNVNWDVCLDVGGYGGVDCVPMSAGVWTVDVTSIVDLSPGIEGIVSQFDNDDDSTLVDWRVPDPRFDANITGNWINFMEFPPFTEVTISVYESDLSPSPLFNAVGTSDDWGNGEINFWDLGLGGMVPGNYVEVEGGGYLKDLVLLPLTLDVFNPDTEYIAGTAPDGELVRVDACNEIVPDVEWDCRSEEVIAAGGVWFVTFTDIDLQPESWYAAFISDGDGDSTMAELSPVPIILAAINGFVEAYDFGPGGTSARLEVHAEDGSGLKCEDNFGLPVEYNIWLDCAEVQPGDQVLLFVNEELVKDHIVFDLSLDDVDLGQGYFAGTAPPWSTVHVSICNPEQECFFAEDNTEDSTIWAIFIDPTSIDPQAWFAAVMFEEDGDHTIAQLPPPPAPPFLTAWPFDDWVDGIGWPLGAMVELIIDDDHDPFNGALYTATAESIPAEWNPDETWVGFNLSGIFDLQSFHVVVMNHGDIFKVHDVTELAVTMTDPAVDIISGTAAPYSEVNVWVNWVEGAFVWAMADGDGVWSADFTGVHDLEHGTGGVAAQFDDDGDGTWADWWIVTPGGIVDEILNMADEDLAPELKRSLTVKIENAIASIEKGNLNAAIRKLNAFINEVKAQSGKKISEEIADMLILYAQNLIQQISMY